MIARSSGLAAIVISTLLLVGAATPARAQVYELEALTEGKPELVLEMGLFGDGDFLGAADASAFSLGLLAGFWYPFTASIAGSVEWGFAYIRLEEPNAEESTFRAGNPLLAVHWFSDRADWRLRAGGGLTLPFAYIPDADSARDLVEALVALVDYAAMAAMYGFWDAWLWLPETFSLVGLVRAEREIGRSMLLGIDGGFAILIPIADNQGDPEVDLQVSSDLAWRIGEIVRLGFRLGFVWIPSEGDDVLGDEDNFQLFLEPFVRADIGRGFLMARLLMNIDEPAGFAFDDDGIWGLFLGGGVKFR